MIIDAPVDVVCVLGRGIEQIEILGTYRWRPTSYLVSPGRLTGFYAKGLLPNDDISVVSGGNANVMALIHFYQMLVAAHRPPALLIFAAGRPPGYIREHPDTTLCEGNIFLEKFSRKVGRENIQSEIMILDQNKNTRDDILGSLATVLGKHLRHVIIITAENHMPRSKALFKFFLPQHPEYRKLKIRFLTSEEILNERYANMKLWRKCLSEIRNSRAYARTMEREHKGIDDLRNGTYKFF